MTMRRPRAWADAFINVTIADGADTAPIDLLVGVVNKLDTFTAIRIIGRLLVYPASIASAVTAAQRVAIGIGVTALEAFSAGAVPDPDGSEYPPRGWLFAESAIMIDQQSSGTVESWHYPEFKFDVGAMRKVDKGVLFCTFSNNNVVGTGNTVRVSGRIRVLCLT